MPLRVIGLWGAMALSALAPAQTASELESSLRGLYAYSPEMGALGKRIEEDIRPNRLVTRVDTRVDRVIFCLTTEEGKIDVRPLASGTVLECSFGDERDDTGAFCVLEKSLLRPLKSSDARSARRKLRQLTEVFRPGWRDTDPLVWLEWVETSDIEFIPRAQDAVVRLPVGDEKTDVVSYRPGDNQKRFFREPGSYWQNLYGKNIAVPKGKWMQLFKDGNYYQVDKGFHLEEWPGEPGVAIRVDDSESWVKVGRGEESFILIEEVNPKDTNWSKYFARTGYQPSNPRVDAIGACSACPKKPKVQ